MQIEGGCYCGAIRYRAEGEIAFKGQCHCRECQYISGGNANVVVAMPEEGFEFTRGEPKTFTRRDLANPVTRYFCGECGTHLLTQSPGAPGLQIIKVGTLDDPAIFTRPDHAIWASEKQDFHHIPEGVKTFDRFPVRD